MGMLHEYNESDQELLFGITCVDIDINLYHRQAFAAFVINLNGVMPAADKLVSSGLITNDILRQTIVNRLNREPVEKGLSQWLNDRQNIAYRSDVIPKERIVMLLKQTIDRFGPQIFCNSDIAKLLTQA